MIRTLSKLIRVAAFVMAVSISTEHAIAACCPQGQLAFMLRERCDALHQALESHWTDASFPEFYDVFEVIGITVRDSTLAKLRLCRVPSERVALRKEYLNRTRSTEEYVEALYLAGARGGEAERMARVRTRRLTAEIELLDEMICAHGGSPTVLESNELTALRLARRMEAEKWAEACEAAMETDVIGYEELVSAWIARHDARLACNMTAAERLTECESLAKTFATWAEKTELLMHSDGGSTRQLLNAQAMRLKATLVLQEARFMALGRAQRVAAAAQIKKIKYELRDTQSRYAEEILTKYYEHVVPLDTVLQAWADACTAAVDACENRTEQVQVLDGWRNRVLETENRLDERTKPDGVLGNSDRYFFLRCKAARLAIDIRREQINKPLRENPVPTSSRINARFSRCRRVQPHTSRL